MRLEKSALEERERWEQLGVKLPEYDAESVWEATRKDPIWIHFGAGNIFRGFIAGLQQKLLDKGLADKGIIAAESFDYGIVDEIYDAHDDLTLYVGLRPDGTTTKEIYASVAEAVRADVTKTEEWARLKEIFEAGSLQMVSFTITEKGYALTNARGEYFPVVEADLEAGCDNCHHAMSILTAMLYHRFQAHATPIAMVSMDNCSHNGEKLKKAILTIAKEWNKRGYVTEEFLSYVEDEKKVSFPWSMIDKITPRPDRGIEEALLKDGIEGISPVVTDKKTFIAPFVNAEIPQYLVIEDNFPNGRPLLEEAGVYLTDRETVNATERMKVTTCLNPLHTGLAVYGCLLGYEKIADEMQDEDLKALVEQIGYQEGMPVVTDPKILSPKAFIKEVLEERLVNPFIPDSPQRIATDTSQKVAIRFGETMKSYIASSELNVADLSAIPLVLAGWLRYLLGVNDQGENFELSSDPMLETLQEQLLGIQFGEKESCKEQLDGILSNANIFGVDLVECGLAQQIKEKFIEMLEGKDAVRRTLHQTVLSWK